MPRLANNHHDGGAVPGIDNAQIDLDCRSGIVSKGAVDCVPCLDTKAPHIVEIPFWQAVSLVSAGQLDAALPIFADVFAKEPVWADLVPRLVHSGLLPDDPEILARIAAQAK